MFEEEEEKKFFRMMLVIFQFLSSFEKIFFGSNFIDILLLLFFHKLCKNEVFGIYNGIKGIYGMAS